LPGRRRAIVAAVRASCGILEALLTMAVYDI
jgi:hypothetical protein